jgi:hypothetical protein
MAQSIEGEIDSNQLPRLFLEHVIGILKLRSGVGAPALLERYALPYYGSTAGMYGFSLCFEYRHRQPPYSRRFLMLSRTHVSKTLQGAKRSKPSLDQLVRELENDVVNAPKDYFGRYHDELDDPGTYATIYCSKNRSRYYFMISESGRMEPYSAFESQFQGLR